MNYIDDRMIRELISYISDDNKFNNYYLLYENGFFENENNIIEFISIEYKKEFNIIQKEIENYIYSIDIEDIKKSDLFRFFEDRKEIRNNIFGCFLKSEEKENPIILDYIIDYFLDRIEISFKKIIDL